MKINKLSKLAFFKDVHLNFDFFLFFSFNFELTFSSIFFYLLLKIFWRERNLANKEMIRGRMTKNDEGAINESMSTLVINATEILWLRSAHTFYRPFLSNKRRFFRWKVPTVLLIGLSWQQRITEGQIYRTSFWTLWHAMTNQTRSLIEGQNYLRSRWLAVFCCLKRRLLGYKLRALLGKGKIKRHTYI